MRTTSGIVVPLPLPIPAKEFDRRITPQAAWVIDTGYRFAKKRNHPDLSAGHLLWAVAELARRNSHSLGGEILLAVGADPHILGRLPSFSPMSIPHTGDLFLNSAVLTVQLGFSESDRLRHGFVTEDHLLLGMAEDELMRRVLREVGVDPDVVLQRVADRIPAQVPTKPAQPKERDLTPKSRLSDRLRKVISCAITSAQNRGMTHVGYEDLAVGLLRENGKAGNKLHEAGISLKLLEYYLYPEVKIVESEQPQHIGLMKHGRKAFAYAGVSAFHRSAQQVEPEDLLLGILRVWREYPCYLTRILEIDVELLQAQALTVFLPKKKKPKKAVLL